MNITLAEYLDGGSIWGSIQTLSPFPFFDDYPPAVLDIQTVFLYGEKTLFSKVEGLTLDQSAAMIVATYSKDWERLIEITSTEFNLGSGKTTSKTEVTDNTENKTIVNDTVNKVSAFNSETMIDDDGSSLNGDEETIGETTKVTTGEELSLENAYKNLTMASKISIINTVVKDCANFLTLSIY